MDWRNAVLQALQRYSRRHSTRKITRRRLIPEEMETIKEGTSTHGRTPDDTLDRVLQELRDEGLVFFLDNRGTYLLLDTPIEVEDPALPERDIGRVLALNKLAFGAVHTSDEATLGRRRIGQAKLRDLTLTNYGHTCAVCDVNDSALLVASHISRWSDDPESRGDLTNIICLCKFHDALFEAGYVSFSDDLRILRKYDGESDTVRTNLGAARTFHLPARFPPDPKYLRKHRERTGLHE